MELDPHTRGDLRRIQIVRLPRPTELQLAQYIEPLARGVFNGRCDVQRGPAWVVCWLGYEDLRLGVDAEGESMILDPAECDIPPQLQLGLRRRRARCEDGDEYCNSAECPSNMHNVVGFFRT